MRIKSPESFAIKLSVAGSVIMTITGILASVYGNSISLLLDALYTLIALIVTLLGLKISQLLKIKWSSCFNFGYYSFEPLFVLVNGLLITILAVSLFISSVESILNGGRIVELTIVTGYLIFSVLVCGCLTVVLKRFTRKTHSEILKAESVSWMLDTLISVVVLIVFVLSFWLNKTRFKAVVPYLDPGITIVLILFFISEPIKLIKSGILDLLLAAPPRKITDEIKEKLNGCKERYGYTDVKIFGAKIGRTIHLDLVCIYNENFEIKTINRLDELRNQIKSEIINFSPHMEIEVTITSVPR